MEKLKVLFLCANPTDKARLDLDREIREIQEKMYAADLRDKVELIVPPAVRARDLVQRLSEVKPHVVHFSGHGSSKREIFLQDDCGKAYPVPENVLNRLFTVMKDDIRLVVLNACSSGPQAKTISRTVDATIGMDAKVGDQAAIVFSAAFYRGIAFGKSVQRAFDEAVLEIMLQNIPEENTPQLFARSDVRPDKLYLLNDSRPSPRPPATIRQDARETKPVLPWQGFIQKLVSVMETGRHIVVWTARHSGRTEFVRSFEAFLEQKRCKWTFLHLQPFPNPGMDESDYFKDLLEQLDEYVPESGDCNSSSDCSVSHAFEKRFKEIVANGDPRVVVLFDCLEKSDPMHLKTIVSFLKRFADKYDAKKYKYNLIFTGGAELHDMCYRHIAPGLSPLRIARPFFLPDLSGPEAVSMMRQGAVPDESQLHETLFQTTGGCFPLLQDAVMHLPDADGDAKRCLARVEKESRLLGETRIMMKNEPACATELSGWLDRMPEYTGELSGIENRKLFWMGLLKTDGEDFSWRCQLVRRVVEKTAGRGVLE